MTVIERSGKPYYGIDLYSDADVQLEAVPDIEVPGGSQLVWFVPGTLDPLRLQELATHSFPGLHLAVVDSESSVGLLAEAGSIAGSRPLHDSFSWTHKLVEALDKVALIVSVNQSENAPKSVQLGGIQPDDLSGYPILSPEKRNVEADSDLRWPTQAMLLPVVNLSLGPSSIRFPVDRGDAVQAATWYLSRACLVATAAGNSGAIPGYETMSAWAEAPWVMAVGATEDEEGTKLLSRSSRGEPTRQDSGPDIVAEGRSFVDRTKTGTSFAAPRVSSCALLCASALLFLRHASQIAAGDPIEGIRLLGLAVVDRFRGDPRTWYVGPPRLPLPVMPALPGFDESEPSVAAFKQIASAGLDPRFRAGPHQMSRLVLEGARSLGRPAYEQGAGFVSRPLVRALLARLTGASWLHMLDLSDHSKLVDARILERPFFSPERVEQLETVLDSTYQMVMWDYPTGRFQVRPESEMGGGNQ